MFFKPERVFFFMENMNRKGQVALFVIIAILIVVAGGLVYNFAIKPSSSEITGVDSVKTFIDDCIDKSFEETVFNLGVTGGYYISTVNKTREGFSYYFDGESLTFPTREKMETEIERGVVSETIFCVGGFSDFSDLDISFGELGADVKILDERIEAEVKFPVSIKKGEESTLLKDFKGYKLNVRLGQIHNGLLKLFQDDYYSQQGSCVSCLLDFMDENSLTVDVYVEEEDQIIVIEDSTLERTDGVFKFIFANRRY